MKIAVVVPGEKASCLCSPDRRNAWWSFSADVFIWNGSNIVLSIHFNTWGHQTRRIWHSCSGVLCSFKDPLLWWFDFNPSQVLRAKCLVCFLKRLHKSYALIMDFYLKTIHSWLECFLSRLRSRQRQNIILAYKMLSLNDFDIASQDVFSKTIWLWVEAVMTALLACGGMH